MGTSLIGRVLALTQTDTPVPYTSRRLGALGSIFGGRGTASRGQQLAAMGSVGTLFAIVNRTSTSTAAVEWNLWRKAKSGKKEDREPVTAHAALDLWNRPNPFFTQGLLVETGQQHVDLVGEGALVVSYAPGIKNLPLELWPVRPDRIAPVPHPTKFIAGYVYTGPDGEKVPLERHEVLTMRMPNPEDPYRGMGPVQSILTDLDSVRYSAEWNRNFFLNGAEPGGIVEVPEQLSDEQFDEMSSRWRQQHQGVRNAHRVAILEQGKWVDRKYTQRDMQFVQLREATSETILEAFGMPKFAVGKVDDVNRAVAEASDAWFGKQLTVPRLERWRDMLNYGLLPLFGETGKGLEFDYVSPVTEDQEAENKTRDSKVAAFEKLLAAGVEPEAAMEYLGLPRMAIVVRGSDAPAEPDAPSEPSAVEQAKAHAEVVQKLYLGVKGSTLLAPAEGRAVLAKAGIELDDTEWAKVNPVEPPAEPDPEADDEENEDPGATPPAEDSAPPAAVGPGNALDHRPRPRAVIEGPDDIDLTPMQEDWEASLSKLMAGWTTISAAQREDLLAQIIDAVDAGKLTKLSALSADSADGAELLLRTMTACAEDAAGHVVREASAQGIEISPETPAEKVLKATAVVTAAILAAELALSAGREAMRVHNPDMTGRQVADLVEEHLRALSDAGPRTALGGALTGAQNAGRTETLLKGPVAALYASEKLDGATCKNCREVHGRFIGTSDGPNTTEEVRKLYPTSGYVNCLGRDRCRGTITGVWRPQQTEGE